MTAMIGRKHAREDVCMQLGTKVTRDGGTENMEGHLRVTAPDVVKIVTVVVSKLKRLAVCV